MGLLDRREDPCSSARPVHVGCYDRELTCCLVYEGCVHLVHLLDVGGKGKGEGSEGEGKERGKKREGGGEKGLGSIVFNAGIILQQYILMWDTSCFR